MSGINKTILLSSLVFIFIFASSVSAFAQLKIGYIRPRYIFDNYKPYQEAQKKLQEYQKTQMDKIQRDSEDFQKKVDDAQKTALLMSEEMKAQKQQELAKQNDALQTAYDELTKVGGLLDQKNEELLQPIINDINEILQRIGESESYDYIFDAEAGGVLYANEKYDISESVLAEINKGISSK